MRRSSRTVACTISALAVLAGFSGCAPEDAVESIQQSETSSCASDRKTLEIAVETYYASGGAGGTATVDALVVQGLLRQPSAAYVIGPDGIAVVAKPGGPCDTSGAAPSSAPAAADGATALTAEQCEADRVTLQAAVDTFGAAYSVSPMSEAELVTAGLLVGEVVGYDLQGATVVPVADLCA